MDKVTDEMLLENGIPLTVRDHSYCRDCPAMMETESAMYSTDMGCLPTILEMKQWFEDTGKVWACHCNQNRVCGGLLNKMKERWGVTIDTAGRVLITEQMSIEEIYEQN